MTKHLLLVDYENVHKIDLSILDDSYRAIIFVGASQNPPKAATKKATAHRFSRVDFQKIAGSGKNALDFHIAFHLGRMFETAPETVCIVVSRDKGYDPLLLHLNEGGLRCRRIESFDELVRRALEVPPPRPSCDLQQVQQNYHHRTSRRTLVPQLRIVRKSARPRAAAVPSARISRAAHERPRRPRPAVQRHGLWLVPPAVGHVRRHLRRRGVDVRRLHCAIRPIANLI